MPKSGTTAEIYSWRKSQRRLNFLFPPIGVEFRKQLPQLLWISAVITLITVFMFQFNTASRLTKVNFELVLHHMTKNGNDSTFHIVA